jgi:hypothetical protein
MKTTGMALKKPPTSPFMYAIAHHRLSGLNYGEIQHVSLKFCQVIFSFPGVDLDPVAVPFDLFGFNKPFKHMLA